MNALIGASMYSSGQLLEASMAVPVKGRECRQLVLIPVIGLSALESNSSFFGDICSATREPGAFAADFGKARSNLVLIFVLDAVIGILGFLFGKVCLADIAQHLHTVLAILPAGLSRIRWLHE